MKTFEIIFGFLWKALIYVKPERGDCEVQHKWRWRVCHAIWVIIGVCIISFCWAQGWLGVSGVALASDVSDMKKSFEAKQEALQTQQNSMQLWLIKGALEKAQMKQCVAINRKNQEALDAANKELDFAGDQYRRLTGQKYDMKPCDVVLIVEDENAPPH